jgi:hypothetical protein
MEIEKKDNKIEKLKITLTAWRKYISIMEEKINRGNLNQ